MRLARSRNRSRSRGQHHSGLRAAQSLRRCGEHHGRTAGVRDSRGPDQSRHERTAACAVRPERPGWADAGQGLAVGAGCRLSARSRQPDAGSAPDRRFPVPVWENNGRCHAGRPLRREGAIRRNAGASLARSAVVPGLRAERGRSLVRLLLVRSEHVLADGLTLAADRGTDTADQLCRGLSRSNHRRTLFAAPCCRGLF